MLTESFIASVGAQSNAHRTDVGRDVAVVVFEHQPIVQIKSSYKKSVTPHHCLAASNTHIFAAQQGKAVVHVYNRDKGNQEATVPFPERVTCIALACADTILIVATCEGRIFFWDTTSGRQVNASQAHLQSVNALAVDSGSNFLVSVSEDSTAQVWSLSHLLSFDTDVDARSPALSFTSHRASVVDVVLGHGSSRQNFAATISKDKTCLIWNYFDSSVLATYLLGQSPAVIQLDAADRALYIGYSDGSLQQISLHHSGAVNGEPKAVMQPGDKNQWKPTDNTHGPILCASIGFDSTQILTGHQSGAILVWDLATGHTRALPLHPPLPGSVTNVLRCPMAMDGRHSFETPSIVKPKFGASQTDSSTMPLDHAMQLHLTKSKSVLNMQFDRVLRSATIPQDMLNRGLAELSSWRQPSYTQANGEDVAPADDYMALDQPPANESQDRLAEENAELKRQLTSLRQVQMATFDRMDKLAAERKALLQREQDRLLQAQPGHGQYDD